MRYVKCCLHVGYKHTSVHYNFFIYKCLLNRKTTIYLPSSFCCKFMNILLAYHSATYSKTFLMIHFDVTH